MRQSQYLESKVLTAPPQRLHLMLIEGAMRFGRQAQSALERGDAVAAAAPLMKVIDIVGELLAGVRKQSTEVNRKLADLYLFLFRRASEAKINTDSAALADVLRVLEIERQTWQMVCDKFVRGSESPASTNPAAPTDRSPRSTPARPGLSLEA
jgi:flagellar protein FliS